MKTRTTTRGTSRARKNILVSGRSNPGENIRMTNAANPFLLIKLEGLFHKHDQMKNRWGWRETWQQSRQVLHRWTQILSVAYALPLLLATYGGYQVAGFMKLTPWRKKKQVTAGRVRLGLQMILGNVRVRDWWNPTCRKFQPPFQSEEPPDTTFAVERQEYMMPKINMAENNPPPLWKLRIIKL